MYARPIWALSPWLLLLASMAPWGCSRSALEVPDPCDEEGATRPCGNHCGNDGSQICQDGSWSACVVPEKYVACTNVCGDGLALCSDNRIGKCEVAEAPPAKTCTTGCGSGLKYCRDGAWGNCEYSGGPRSCTNDCSLTEGDGIQYCNKDAWSPCEVPRREEACLSACGSGKKVCERGKWAACDAPQPMPPRLRAIIRDFTPKTNPDFERPDIHTSIDDRNVLLTELGADGLPVFASTGATRTISGPSYFNQWYRDVPGTNQTTTVDLQLAPSPKDPGLFVYENNAFFPIDNQLFGNYSSYNHNYHFTLMVATAFVYVGGETFSFSGDDDMWVFINRKLAIDLGGVHQSETAAVDLNESADKLGIVTGGRYDLHFFFAERRTTASNFTIRTSIADVGACP